MEPPRDAPLEDALEHLRDADRLFVRLALSRGDDDRTVLRSLMMDVLPERWLISHDQALLAPWLKDQRVFECQSALFFCGLLPGDTVRGWFTRRDDCGLTGFDNRPGSTLRRVGFSLPELHNTTIKWRLPSYGLNGAKVIPYPSVLYSLTQKQRAHVQHHDDDPLVGEDGDYFPSFRIARAELIFGVTDRNQAYQRDDMLAVRVVDARGWLQGIRVMSDRVVVTVAGMDAIGKSFVSVEGEGLQVRQPVFDHRIPLDLPSLTPAPSGRFPDHLEIHLLGAGTVLDEAVAANSSHPFLRTSPQVIVEQDSFLGRDMPAQRLSATYIGTDARATEDAPALSTAATIPAVPPKHAQLSQPIFISYRRDDSTGHAGHLRADFIRRYGANRVFMDLAIEPGADFVTTLEDAVSSCAVLLAVIGRQWLTVTDANTGARRLDDPNDFVRLEIVAALRRGIRVIPLLVYGAHMPRAENLPDDLKPLARRQAHEMTDLRWEHDLERLAAVIDTIVEAAQ